MTYVLVLVTIFTLLLGGIIGYTLGKHEAHLIKALKLAETNQKPHEKPTVILGTYEPPKQVGDPDKRPVGIVDAKTPELMAWENEQKIEKEVLGR